MFETGQHVSYAVDGVALAGTAGRIAEVTQDGSHALVYWNSGATSYLSTRNLAHRGYLLHGERAEA